MSRTLAPEYVLPLLRGTFGRPYVYHDTVASTQELARVLSPGGVVACELQTAGRGRLGSAWQCPHGAGVMFSLALEPRTPVERLAPLSLVVADAVCDAIGGGAQVHWPNDIVIAERKVTGILVEFRDGQAIVGVGVNANLTAEELPPDTRVPATSLSLERGAPVDRPQLLADLLYAIEQRFEAFEQNGFGGLEHDGLRGRTITLVGGEGGVVRGVDADGRLQVDDRSYSSAEVSAISPAATNVPGTFVASGRLERNPLTGTPVVIAPARAKRPGAAAQQQAAPECPLCEGHESMTPPEVLALGRAVDEAADTPGWQLRVVPNKFPAIPGQEVIVHAPAHITRFTSLGQAALERVSQAWRLRLDAALDAGAAWAMVGINEGRAAGASLEHSHSQLVPFTDVPPVPLAAAPRLTAADCELCAALSSQSARMVWQNDALMAFCPAWAQMAREVWIVPRAHVPRMSPADGLAAAVAEIAGRLEHTVAADVAWNLVLYESPAGVTDSHWHAQVMPRTAVPAAVELGAGVWVDAVDPDAAAAELKLCD